MIMQSESNDPFVTFWQFNDINEANILVVTGLLQGGEDWLLRKIFFVLALAILTCTGCSTSPTVDVNSIKISPGNSISFNQVSGAHYLTMRPISGKQGEIADLLNADLHNAKIVKRYPSTQARSVESPNPNYIEVYQGKAGEEIRILQYQTYTTSKLENMTSIVAHTEPNEVVVYTPDQTPVIIQSESLYALISGNKWEFYFGDFG